ncbi:hypothetical protein, conserved [Leishmania tarentolae]|uniref:Uncharacterized protein n=1 Tax=Leishmania tarentolae TaxID=5689 RepID=A0A640KUE8_LEITA|nr:hypothetical protein, conserved [Leishmania tarentolae]
MRFPTSLTPPIPSASPAPAFLLCVSAPLKRFREIHLRLLRRTSFPFGGRLGCRSRTHTAANMRSSAIYSDRRVWRIALGICIAVGGHLYFLSMTALRLSLLLRLHHHPPVRLVNRALRSARLHLGRTTSTSLPLCLLQQRVPREPLHEPYCPQLAVAPTLPLHVDRLAIHALRRMLRIASGGEFHPTFLVLQREKRSARAARLLREGNELHATNFAVLSEVQPDLLWSHVARDGIKVQHAPLRRRSIALL